MLENFKHLTTVGTPSIHTPCGLLIGKGHIEDIKRGVHQEWELKTKDIAIQQDTLGKKTAKEIGVMMGRICQ